MIIENNEGSNKIISPDCPPSERIVPSQLNFTADISLSGTRGKVSDNDFGLRKQKLLYSDIAILSCLDQSIGCT